MLDKLDRLFREQMASWPMLTRGIDSLKRVRTRMVDVNGYRVQVRHLPHRIASTTALVDAESVAKRPCFLCEANLPAEEKGVAFGEDFTIYCNPFPILDRHVTIVHREHRPQRIAGRIRSMAELSDALPGYFVIYNGPECGASAPDHLHFQACLAEGVPVVDDVDRAVGGTMPDYGRRARVFRDSDRSRLIAQVESAVGSHEPEPMLNLAMFRRGDELAVVLFPRSKHRPKVFYSGESTVSPAAIDLCGIFVTPRESDFAKITGEDIKAIYDEVAG